MKRFVMNHRSLRPKPRPRPEVPPAWFASAGRRALTAVILYGIISMTGNALAAEAKGPIGLHSPAFGNGGAIPMPYTCEGKDLSPPLAWEGVPRQARSLVLIVVDPDAPDPEAPKMTWVHWVVYNIPPAAAGLPEAVTPQKLPSGTGQGLNDWKRTGYGGPCPPVGRHRYFFRLYALDTRLSGMISPTRAQIEAAMRGHIIARAELMGTYKKNR